VFNKNIEKVSLNDEVEMGKIYLTYWLFLSFCANIMKETKKYYS
jgi:hypothetical protein